jgi:type IV pilus assembly protein PilW
MNVKTSHLKSAQRPQRPASEVRDRSARRRGGRRAHRGFSLVELMVAVVISSLVLIAVIQVFLSNRESFRLQTNLGRVQENSRFSMGHLGRVIRLGGYWGIDKDDWVLGVLSQTNGGVTPVSGTNNDTNGSDTITVVFRGIPDGFTTDCQGIVRNNAAETISNRFRRTATNQLECGVAVDGVFGAFQPLVDGVEAMHILYGLDTDADGSANQYVPVAGVGNFDNVVSVRIGLLLVTDDDALAAQTDTANYTILDQTFTAPGDRRLRRLLVRTIKLRNK